MDELKVDQVRRVCACGDGVARELLTLSGGDLEMAIDASLESESILEAKAKVLNKRFEKLERMESHGETYDTGTKRLGKRR